MIDEWFVAIFDEDVDRMKAMLKEKRVDLNERVPASLFEGLREPKKGTHPIGIETQMHHLVK